MIRGVRAVLARPRLWAVAIVTARAALPVGWWRRRPFLPLPDRRYVRFRLLTQYGSADAEPDPMDLVRYLEWCRTQRI